MLLTEKLHSIVDRQITMSIHHVSWTIRHVKIFNKTKRKKSDSPLLLRITSDVDDTLADFDEWWWWCRFVLDVYGTEREYSDIKELHYYLSNSKIIVFVNPINANIIEFTNKLFFGILIK